MQEKTNQSSELAALIRTRLEDIAHYKSQGEVSDEIGFATRNVVTILKKGVMKLSLDKVEATAKALDLPLEAVMLPALRQYYSQDVINAIRDALDSTITKTERDVIALVREALAPGERLSFETREKIKAALAENQAPVATAS
jgi:hypothetical protein